MYPVLFEIGRFKFNSFGLMLVLAFLLGGMIVSRELRRRGGTPAFLEAYPLAALIGGLVGARLYYIVSHLSTFMDRPFATAFGASGLTWYGGLIGGAVAVLTLGRRTEELVFSRGRLNHGPSTVALWVVVLGFVVGAFTEAESAIWKGAAVVVVLLLLLAKDFVVWPKQDAPTSASLLADAFAPGLAVAYGVGRIGCQLAGDGDYGPPTDLPWGTAFPNGVVPTLEKCHPTPVYEVLMMAVVFAILWFSRLRLQASGKLFALYLMLAGVERWIAEIFRVRDVRPGGMSVAQWISVAAVLIGVWLFTRARERRNA